jgi:CRP-like cAMP-binding protein
MIIDDILARRLANFVPLAREEQEYLAGLTGDRTRRVTPHRDIIREGEIGRSVHLVLSGWAYGYKVLEDGRRQITGILLPGDLCELGGWPSGQTDHSIGAVTAVQIAEIARERLDDAGAVFPNIRLALEAHAQSVAAMQREWMVNLGVRSSFERLAHLFCELHHRLRAVALNRGDCVDFPLTQNDLADAAGLTAVHVNRTLQQIRAEGLIVLRDRTLRVPNLAALERAALFTPDYLKLAIPDASKTARHAFHHGQSSHDRS